MPRLAKGGKQYYKKQPDFPWIFSPKICLKAQFLIRTINDKLLASRFQKEKKGQKWLTRL
jgi:hypothetical protein